MDEISKQPVRQANWQKNRKTLSWPEKVRQAEAIRDAIKALRKTKIDSLQSSYRPALKALTPTGTKN